MQSELPRIEACYTPREFHQYEKGFELIVVIDVLRATSAICAAIENGVKGIIPVDSVDEAREYLKKGYLAAAEREGQIVEGFTMGNSPVSFLDPKLKGETIVLTTTNGTKAIKIAEHKETVVIGSLNNLQSLTEWLIRQERNTLILASGWKDKFNLEDTICAGAIIDGVMESGKFASQKTALSPQSLFIDRQKKTSFHT